MRALWKGRYFSLQGKFRKNYIRIFDRASAITKDFVGKRVYVYSGMRYSSFLVRPLMVGMRFGNFALTKKLGSKIHDTLRNKKKGKK